MTPKTLRPGAQIERQCRYGTSKTFTRESFLYTHDANTQPEQGQVFSRVKVLTRTVSLPRSVQVFTRESFWATPCPALRPPGYRPHSEPARNRVNSNGHALSLRHSSELFDTECKFSRVKFPGSHRTRHPSEEVFTREISRLHLPTISVSTQSQRQRRVNQWDAPYGLSHQKFSRVKTEGLATSFSDPSLWNFTREISLGTKADTCDHTFFLTSRPSITRPGSNPSGKFSRVKFSLHSNADLSGGEVFTRESFSGKDSHLTRTPSEAKFSRGKVWVGISKSQHQSRVFTREILGLDSRGSDSEQSFHAGNFPVGSDLICPRHEFSRVKTQVAVLRKTTNLTPKVGEKWLQKAQTFTLKASMTVNDRQSSNIIDFPEQSRLQLDDSLNSFSFPESRTAQGHTHGRFINNQGAPSA